MCYSAVSDTVQVITVITNSAQAHNATVTGRPNHLIAAVANKSPFFVGRVRFVKQAQSSSHTGTFTLLRQHGIIRFQADIRNTDRKGKSGVETHTHTSPAPAFSVSVSSSKHKCCSHVNLFSWF